MLTDKQIKEIKEHLEKAQNPIFFYDNDPDGLCSFLLLQRYIERGRGVAIRSFPELDVNYFRKIEELGADYIFILDKPLVSQSFWNEVEKVNLPVVWIDHHDVGEDNNIPDFVNYYNPVFNKIKTSEPVTALCWQIVNSKKDDLWLAVAGSISDHFFPTFYKDFKDKFPDLSIESKEPFEIFYNSEIGKIARIFSFALKDRVTNVVSMQKFLSKVKTPNDVLEETTKNYLMHLRFNQINKKYSRLVEKAVSVEKDSEKILFFQYGGDLSISSDLSNELSYRYPKKTIVVIYITGIKANISVRGKNVKEKVLKVIKSLDWATGGGHDNAIGAQIKIEDLEIFKERLEESLK